MNYFILQNKMRIYFFNLFAKLKGFNFKVAETKEEINQAYHLRWKVYAKEGYINPDDYPEEKMTDHYDAYSTNFLAFYREIPIATVRLIKDSSFGFPTENLFNIEKVPSRGYVREVARLVIIHDFRNQAKRFKRLVMFGLAIRMYTYCVQHEVYYWIANMPEKLADSYKYFGAFFDKLPEMPPTQKHMEARKIIAGYFNKQVLHPYFLDIRTIHLHILKLKK